MSQNEDTAILIEMDGNLKFGDEIIKGDPNCMSENGKLMMGIIERKNLHIVNAMQLCEGIITRYAVKDGKEEKAVLDYFIVCDKLVKFVTKMTIDEKRIHVLTKYCTTKGQQEIVETDHNTLICELDIKYCREVQKKRIEVFNFKNEESQKSFLDETNNITKLTECFDGNEDIETKNSVSSPDCP